MISVEKISPREAARVRVIMTGFLLLIVITVIVTPSDIIAAFFPSLFRFESSCIMLNIAGIPCPFCGMSRAFRELTALNIPGSIYYNPVGIPFFIISGAVIAWIYLLSFMNRKLKLINGRKTLLILSGVLLIMWFINILYGHQS